MIEEFIEQYFGSVKSAKSNPISIDKISKFWQVEKEYVIIKLEKLSKETESEKEKQILKQLKSDVGH